MNKTLRNKALAGASKLLEADVNGETWYTDTYIATKHNIFEGYKPRKYQEDYRGKPKPNLGSIVGKQDLKLAEFEEVITVTGGELELKKISNIDGQTEYVNKRYTDLVESIYPNAVPWLDTKTKVAPVYYRVGFETVAVIMPIRY